MRGRECEQLVMSLWSPSWRPPSPFQLTGQLLIYFNLFSVSISNNVGSCASFSSGFQHTTASTEKEINYIFKAFVLNGFFLAAFPWTEASKLSCTRTFYFPRVIFFFLPFSNLPAFCYECEFYIFDHLKDVYSAS